MTNRSPAISLLAAMSTEDEQFPNEASVEWRVVHPLLLRLNYDLDDVHPKYPVQFREGRRGRKPEADFVVFSGRPHGRSTSLIVVEAKKPGEPAWDAKEQAESYQHAIRAPFALIVDGATLEVWQYQPADESECILRLAIGDLEAEFGRLNLILSKEAAIAHRAKLRKPSVGDAINDWTDYVNTELDRLDTQGEFVERTLFNEGAGQECPSSTVLGSFPKGAIITGASGFGKTSMCISMLRSALEHCELHEIDKVPVHIPLGDLAPSQTVASFVTARLAAHKPGLIESGLRLQMKEQGVLFLIDTFDRLSSTDQQLVEAELRNLSRDFPKNQVVVFSRKAMRPALEFPVLDLQPLTPDQQHEFVKAIAGAKDFHFWYTAPGLLRELCKVPLLLKLVVDFKKRQQKLPSSLSELFRNWLESVIATDGRSQLPAIRRERALRVLAGARSNAELTASRAVELLEAQGISAAVLDELVQCDAIICEQGRVRFPHEALADYLHALDIMECDETKAIQRIQQVGLEPDSYFPVLLMGLSKSVAVHQEIWKRVGECGVRTYFNVLRYRADLTEELAKKSNQEFSTGYLQDLLDGLDEPLTFFFPQLAAAARRALVGDDCECLAILGNATPGWVNYAIVPSAPDTPRVEVGDVTKASLIYGIDLKLSHLKPDSGRLIGADRLREAIEAVVKLRSFHSGPALACERVLGRLRYLRKEYGMELPNDTIDGVAAFLEPHAGQHALWPDRYNRSSLFQIDEVLGDLRTLQSSGNILPQPWWRADGLDGEPDGNSHEELVFAFDALYRRAQLVYDEIVRCNFASVSEELPFFNMLPVRWTVSPTPATPDDKREPWYFRHYMPVAEWKSAGATVSTTAIDMHSFNRDHYQAVVHELAKLGRLKSNVSVRWNAGYLEHFGGIDKSGWFDGETAALRMACSWLKDDLKALFADLPKS